MLRARLSLFGARVCARAIRRQMDTLRGRCEDRRMVWRVTVFSAWLSHSLWEGPLQIMELHVRLGPDLEEVR